MEIRARAGYLGLFSKWRGRLVGRDVLGWGWPWWCFGSMGSSSLWSEGIGGQEEAGCVDSSCVCLEKGGDFVALACLSIIYN